MTTMASQITRLAVVYSTVYSDADQRKHQSSASLAFVRGTGDFPAQMASYAEIVSIWWRHHVFVLRKGSPVSFPYCTGAKHKIDVIRTTMASQITSLAVVYSTVYSDTDQRKHQSSASLAFVWEIYRGQWIPRTKGQLRGKCFHLMTSSWMGIKPSVRLPSCIIFHLFAGIASFLNELQWRSESRVGGSCHRFPLVLDLVTPC